MAKLVSVADPAAKASYRYIITVSEPASDGWEAMVTQVLPPTPYSSVVLPKDGNRSGSERAALELAWAHLREKHHGLDVPPPNRWQDIGG
jgi:hypothetical protein